MKRDRTAMRQRYRGLKLAQTLYHCAPWQLSVEQTVLFERQLARQSQIETAVGEQAALSGVPVTERAFDQARAHLQGLFGDALAELLVQADISPDVLDDLLLQDARLEAQLLLVAQRAPVLSDEQIGLWYAQNAEKFQRPEQRQARHILITAEETPQSERLTMALINDLHRQLCADQTLFAALALRHSHCPTALEGGLLGWVSRGVLFASLDSLLFTLSAGELGPVTASPLGLHVLRCDAIREASPIPRQQALQMAREQWQAHQQRQFQKQWLAQLI